MISYYYSDGTIENHKDNGSDYYYYNFNDYINAAKILHRLDGPAITSYSGVKIWYQYGLMHRENGPAYITPRIAKEWYQYGKRHRIAGPAIVWNSGADSYYINGTFYTEENYYRHPLVVAHEANKAIKDILGENINSI